MMRWRNIAHNGSMFFQGVLLQNVRNEKSSLTLLEQNEKSLKNESWSRQKTARGEIFELFMGPKREELSRMDSSPAQEAGEVVVGKTDQTQLFRIKNLASEEHSEQQQGQDVANSDSDDADQC